MKRILFLLVVIFPLVFLSCEDEELNKKTIINLSGVTWYDTNVYLIDIDQETLKKSIEVGTVEVSKSCTVKSIYPYFRISAKDIHGKIILSRLLGISEKTVTVGEKDFQ
ncbi:MAG: hypothetical protein EZS26_000728 [Candidatus Ordinivivax streblomastigis]|uniref:Uncharacterized protein n=1 Tax=Candidatus Ordinivivax streblomastigis TaxID=2540710 RepID=A0A5M8P3R7_9BACT|nr:MAG: hypothetical protein EZS26_000728 [Candidatus Ordinivivax streblomastigis]